MKQKITWVGLCLSFGLLLSLVCGSVYAKSDKVSIGVAEFKNETAGRGYGGAYWWGNSSVGWELSGMLSNELAATNSFNVVERNMLEEALYEQDLAASGRIAQDSAAQTGELTGAQYLVMGTVTAYEENTKGTGGGIGYKGFRIGGSSTEAYIAVDVRVMNSTTGEIEYVRTIEGTSKGSGVSLGAHRSGFNGSLATENKTPAGKAIRAALIYISDYLDCVMVDQGRCTQDYEAADERRKEKTRSAIELD